MNLAPTAITPHRAPFSAFAVSVRHLAMRYLAGRQLALLLISLCLNLGLATRAQAADLAQLYSGEVLVGEQTPSEAQLVRQAFLAMLVKLTGAANPNTLPGLGEGLADAGRMASRVGFVSFDPPEALRLSLVASDGKPAQRLFRASFSPSAVDQWLRLRQIPRWSPERPSLQLWLAYEQDGQRRLIFDHDDPLRWWLQNSASQRGLPVEWPLALRLYDPKVYQQALAGTWGGFPEDLPDATPGAKEHQLLLAAAQPLRDTWRVRWRLFNEAELTTYVSEAPNLAHALEQGLHQAADRMAQHAMLQDFGGQEQVLLLRINDVQSAADYGRVMQALRQLSQTIDVQVQQAAASASSSKPGHMLELRLQARAGEDWLRQALRVSPVLEIVPNSFDTRYVELRLRR